MGPPKPSEGRETLGFVQTCVIVEWICSHNNLFDRKFLAATSPRQCHQYHQLISESTVLNLHLCLCASFTSILLAVCFSLGCIPKDSCVASGGREARAGDIDLLQRGGGLCGSPAQDVRGSFRLG